MSGVFKVVPTCFRSGGKDPVGDKGRWDSSLRVSETIPEESRDMYRWSRTPLDQRRVICTTVVRQGQSMTVILMSTTSGESPFSVRGGRRRKQSMMVILMSTTSRESSFSVGGGRRTKNFYCTESELGMIFYVYGWVSFNSVLGVVRLKTWTPVWTVRESLSRTRRYEGWEGDVDRVSNPRLYSPQSRQFLLFR